MKVRFFSFFMTVVFVLAAAAPPRIARAHEKRTVAVAGFYDQTGKGLGPKATKIARDIFAELKYFNLVDSGAADKAYQDAGGASAELCESAASQIGKKLGANLVVVGSVTKADYAVEQSKTNVKGVIVHNCAGRASVSVNVKIVDVETGSVAMTDTLVGYDSESYSPNQSLVCVTDPHVGPAIDRATISAVDGLYRKVQAEFPLTGYIIKVEDRIAWIDFGSDLGIKPGRKFTIYRAGETMTHPVTGEPLANNEKIASDKVNEVQAEMSSAKLKKKVCEEVKPGDVVIAEPEGMLLRLPYTGGLPF